MKVLVVDDEPLILALYPPLLAKHGIEAVAFDNAKASIEYLKTDTVDAVISDIDMPECDGIEFFKTLKDQNIYSGIFVFATAKWKDEYKYLMDEGVDKVFTKPFKHKDLASYLLGLKG